LGAGIMAGNGRMEEWEEGRYELEGCGSSQA
jgi:hypothetical protein